MCKVPHTMLNCIMHLTPGQIISFCVQTPIDLMKSAYATSPFQLLNAAFVELPYWTKVCKLLFETAISCLLATPAVVGVHMENERIETLIDRVEGDAQRACHSNVLAQFSASDTPNERTTYCMPIRSGGCTS